MATPWWSPFTIPLTVWKRMLTTSVLLQRDPWSPAGRTDSCTTRTSNNTASVATQVIAVADLDLTVTAAPNPVHEGSNLTYTLTWINLGPSDAVQGSILQYFPKGFQFLGATLGPCNAADSVMLCRLGADVPAGYGLTFQATYKIPSNFLGAKTSQNVTSQIGIRSQVTDPDPPDGANLVTTTVVK